MGYLRGLVLLVTAFSTLSIDVNASSGRVGRFAIAKRAPTPTHNLTSGELYVRSLISRKPTRRTTAQRRQISNIPDAGTGELGVEDGGIFEPVGNLVYNAFAGSWGLSSDPASTLVLTSFDEAPINPIQYVDGTYMTLASCDYLSQSTADAFYMGGGSSSYLCIINVDLGSSAPASTPSTRSDMDGNVQVYETAVWNVGSTANPQWTNSQEFGYVTSQVQLVQVTSVYLWPQGQLLAVADVGVFLDYIEREQVENGYPLDEFPVILQEISMKVTPVA